MSIPSQLLPREFVGYLTGCEFPYKHLYRDLDLEWHINNWQCEIIVPCDQVFSYLSCAIDHLYTAIRCLLLCSSVRFILDSFYLFTSQLLEKVSTCVSRLPFAVNVTPDLSIIQKCICPHKYFVLFSFLSRVLRHRMENKTYSWSILGLQAKRNWAGKTK